MDEYYDDSDFNTDWADEEEFAPSGGGGDYPLAEPQDYSPMSYEQDFNSAPNAPNQMDYGAEPYPGATPSLFSDDEGWAPEGDPQIHEEADSWAPLGDPQEHEPADEKAGEGGGTRPLNRSGYPTPGGKAAPADKTRQGLGSGSSRSIAGGASSTSTTTPTRPPGAGPLVQPPTRPTVPVLTMPARDPQRVRELVQEAAAPAIRGLRDQYRKIMNQHYDNPNVRRMTLREAMSGYGGGLDKVFGGARQYATNQYEHEYADKSTEARANWQANVNAENDTYNKAWQEWFKNYGSTTEKDVSGFGTGYSQPMYKYYDNRGGRNTL